MPDKNKYEFVASEKMPSGMTASVTFTGYYWDRQKNAEFWITLAVFKKRKQLKDLALKTTGKDGLLPLLFAKKAIIDFEKYILNKYGKYHEKMSITIGWTDNHRRNVYERGLKNCGFVYHKDSYGKKVLLKRIK